MDMMVGWGGGMSIVVMDKKFVLLLISIFIFAEYDNYTLGFVRSCVVVVFDSDTKKIRDGPGVYLGSELFILLDGY